MNDNPNDMEAALLDAVYHGLPREISGWVLDPEFNDDNTVTVRVGGEEYVISVKKEN